MLAPVHSPARTLEKPAHLATHPMLPRVQTAIDVKEAIGRASSLDKIGFDASVLEDGYSEIRSTLEYFTTDGCPSPDPDETTLAVPGGGIIDKTQMVRHLSKCRVHA